MINTELITWAIGGNVGLASVATIFASAWVRVNRIDKLEESIDKLWEKITNIGILSNKIENVEQSIIELKQMIHNLRAATE